MFECPGQTRSRERAVVMHFFASPCFGLVSDDCCYCFPLCSAKAASSNSAILATWRLVIWASGCGIGDGACYFRSRLLGIMPKFRGLATVADIYFWWITFSHFAHWNYFLLVRQVNDFGGRFLWSFGDDRITLSCNLSYSRMRGCVGRIELVRWLLNNAYFFVKLGKFSWDSQ